MSLALFTSTSIRCFPMLILSICLLWTVQYPSWMQFYLPSSLSTTSAPSLLFAQGSLRQAEQLCTRLLDHVATNNSHHTSINPHIIPKSHDIEVVDIILLVHVPKKTVYKYFLDESFMASPLFTHFMHQNKDNPQDNKVRIHMFVDSDEVKQHLSSFKFLYLHDMRDYQYLEDEFFALYKPNHHSINNVYYEFLCFYRWLLYDRMISDWNHNVTTNKDNYDIHKRSGPPIKHVLTIDSDVFLLVDVIDLFHRLFHASSVVFGQSDIELVVLSPGAFHIWTSQGLQNYASFVHRWYNDTTDNILRRTKANTGILFHVLHLSDMGMIREFSLHNHHSRSFCFVQNQLHTLANVQATRSKLQNETIEILQCIPMGVYDNFIPGNPLQYHINRTFGVVQSEYEKYPYCYMHFQGDRAKEDFLFFAKYMIVSKDISYHAPKDHQVVVMNNLSHPLIVHVHENGRVFYFEMDASGGKKHFMKQLFYKEARCEALNQFVIREVPRDLTQHIPGGSTLDNNHSLIRKWCTDDSVNNNHNHNRNSHKQKTSL